jgi:hypothetical protein
MQKRRKKEAEIVRLEAEAMTAMTKMQQLCLQKKAKQKSRSYG